MAVNASCNRYRINLLPYAKLFWCTVINSWYMMGSPLLMSTDLLWNCVVRWVSQSVQGVKALPVLWINLLLNISLYFDRNLHRWTDVWPLERTSPTMGDLVNPWGLTEDTDRETDLKPCYLDSKPSLTNNFSFLPLLTWVYRRHFVVWNTAGSSRPQKTHRLVIFPHQYTSIVQSPHRSTEFL